MNREKSNATMGRDILLVTAAVLLLLVPFLNKAYHIDDTLFLKAARHIVEDPGNFYGSMVNWYGFFQQMSSVNQNPPLVSYYIALISLLGGWSETVLHSAFLVPALFFSLGTYLLARLLCPLPLVAALTAVFTPVFAIQATNVMSDVLMCAFYVWGVYLWVLGVERDRQGPLFLAVVAISFGFLTKYFAASAIGLLAVYTVGREKRASLKLLWLLLPVAVIVIYQWWTKSLYGHGLLSSAVLYPSTYKQAGWLQVFDKTLIGLSFTGGCVCLSLFVAPLIYQNRLAAVAAIVCFVTTAAVLFMRGSIGDLQFQTSDAICWGKLLQMALWVAVGIHVFFVGMIDMHRHRDMASLLLFLWTAGTFVFSVYFNWAVNGRTILPMVPAVAIQHARLIARDKVNGAGELPAHHLWLAVIPAFFLTCAVAWADAALAGAQRTAAEAVMNDAAKFKGRVWFQGHWGFQYYMEKFGATPYDFKAPMIQPGDFLVLPLNNTNTQEPGFSFQVVKKYSFSPLRWLTTMNSPPVGAGFYADVWGPLPYSFGQVPDEEYLLFSFAPSSSTSR